MSHLDWFPTITAIAGVEVPRGVLLRGRDVRDILRGRSGNESGEFFAQFDIRNGTRMRSYQTKRWKLVRYLERERADEMYNRLKDPSEQHNLIASADDEVLRAVKELSAKLEASMRTISDPWLGAVEEHK